MTAKPDSEHNRMLLSHNFTLTEGETHPRNREEFAEAFVKALNDQPGNTAAQLRPLTGSSKYATKPVVTLR